MSSPGYQLNFNSNLYVYNNIICIQTPLNMQFLVCLLIEINIYVTCLHINKCNNRSVKKYFH